MSNICPPESSDREVSAGKTRGRKRRGERVEAEEKRGSTARDAYRHKLKKPS